MLKIVDDYPLHPHDSRPEAPAFVRASTGPREWIAIHFEEVDGKIVLHVTGDRPLVIRVVAANDMRITLEPW